MLYLTGCDNPPPNNKENNNLSLASFVHVHVCVCGGYVKAWNNILYMYDHYYWSTSYQNTSSFISGDGEWYGMCTSIDQMSMFDL